MIHIWNPLSMKMHVLKAIPSCVQMTNSYNPLGIIKVTWYDSLPRQHTLYQVLYKKYFHLVLT